MNAIFQTFKIETDIPLKYFIYIYKTAKICTPNGNKQII